MLAVFSHFRSDVHYLSFPRASDALRDKSLDETWKPCGLSQVGIPTTPAEILLTSVEDKARHCLLNIQPMKKDLLLIATSVLSIVLLTIHLAGDIILGMEKGGALTLIVFPILTVWLYGTLVLSGKRSGYVIMLLGALLGLLMPVVHMRGNGMNPELMKVSGAFMFVWTLIALGVTSLFALTLSVIELRRLAKKSNGQ